MEDDLNQALSSLRISISSGVCSSIGILPHFLFLIVIYLMNRPAPLAFLIPTYIASIFLGEIFFWRIFKAGISSNKNPKSDFSLKNSDSGYFIGAYASEILIDIILIFLAMKASWNPLHAYLILLGCKLLAAPLQTSFFRVYLSKNTSFGISVGFQLVCLFIAHENPDLLLYALIAKGLFCNAIAVARSQYAEESLIESSNISKFQ